MRGMFVDFVTLPIFRIFLLAFIYCFFTHKIVLDEKLRVANTLDQTHIVRNKLHKRAKLCNETVSFLMKIFQLFCLICLVFGGSIAFSLLGIMDLK